MKSKYPTHWLLAMSTLLFATNVHANNHLLLNGSDAYMSVASHSDLNIDPSKSFTITAQVNSATIGDYSRILNKRASSGIGYELFTRNTNGALGLNLQSATGGSGPGYSSAVISDGSWRHVAFVVDRVTSSSSIYVDGILQATKTLSSISTADFSNGVDFILGKGKSSDTFYHGALDNVRVWSKAMTTSELLSDKSATVTGTENSLLAAWDFEDVTGTQVSDVSNRNHSGTLVGGAKIITPDSSPLDSLIHNVVDTQPLPAGRGNIDEPVTGFNINNTNLNSLTVSSVTLDLDNTDMSNISNIKVYFTGSSNNLSVKTLFGTAYPAAGQITITGNQTIHSGSNHFVVTYDIAPEAIEGATISANVGSYTVGTDVLTLAESTTNTPRVILLNSSTLWESQASLPVYRIPAVTTTLKGTVIAAIDQRFTNKDIQDTGTNIDIVVKRSTDNGKTWSSNITLADLGDEGASDPAIITDKITGDIVALFLTHNGIFGSSPSNRARIQMVRSKDDGITWSTPVDLSNYFYPSGWYMSWLASGSLNQTASGRMIGVVTSRQNSSRAFTNHYVYSDDGGYSWAIEQDTPNTNAGDESKVVELTNGDLLMNMRRSGGYRFTSKSTDGGVNWSTGVADTELVDPKNNADIIRYTLKSEGADKDRLLFSNATTSSSPRDNLTVYLSTDEGENWTINKQLYALLGDYTTLTVLANGNIGVVYETQLGKFDIHFAEFSLDWLSSGADSYITPEAPLAPSSLLAQQVSININLSWSDDSLIETGFEILRSTAPNSGYSVIGRVVANITTYTDDSIRSGNTYYYKINAYNPGGSSPSNVTSITAINDSLTYCVPSPIPSVANGGISRMEIIANGGSGTILLDNNTSKLGYDDQTNIPINISRGTTNRIIFTTTNTSNDRKFVTLQADFNQDGDFDDIREQMLNWSSETYDRTTYQFSSGLVVPSDANLGGIRFRVIFKTEALSGTSTGVATSCGNIAYGEVEDMTINITP